MENDIEIKKSTLRRVVWTVIAVALITFVYVNWSSIVGEEKPEAVPVEVVG